MLDYDRRKHSMAVEKDSGTGSHRQDESEQAIPQARDALLSALSRELGGLTSVVETMESLGKMVGTSLKVQHCIFAEFTNDVDQSMISYGWHAPGARPLFGIYPMRDFLSNEQRAQINAGTLPVIAGRQTIARVDAESYGEVDIYSFIIVPVVRADHWRFMLCIIDTNEREWREDEITLAREVAERVWLRLGHAHSEEALRKSESRFRSLFDSIDEGYALYELLHDVDGRPVDARILAANPAYSALTGRRDPVGKTLTSLSPTVPQAWIDILASVATTRTPERFERYNPEIERWFDIFIAPAPDAEDNQVLLVFTEITERRRMIEALRESEARYRTLFDSIDQGFCTVEVLFDTTGEAADYRFLEINPSFARISGLEQALGERMRALAPSHEEHWFRVFGQVARTREPVRFEAEAAALGRWFNVYAYPIGNPEDHQVAILFEDVTDRRKADAALRASEERVRAIVEEATDYAIFTIDPIMHIEDWFPGAEAVFGWSADEAVGMPFADTFTPEDRAACAPDHEFEQARQQGSAPDVRWHQHKDGSRVFIDGVTRARFDLDGTFLGALKIGRDATQERLAEQRRIEHEERIQRSLRDKVAAATSELRALSRRLLLIQEEERRFLARELHDEIGQMLTGLSLTLSTAATTDGQLAEAQRIVAELTEQVRQLSMDLRPAALDAYGLTPALRGHIERYEKQTGVTVDLRVEGLERRFASPVESTAYRIVQEALTNLARHAETTQAIVQLFADEQTLTVSIRDNGSGFDPAKVRDGSGLGGMRERAELLGGSLDIDTAPGAGVRITAELPLTTSPPTLSSGVASIGKLA